MVEYKNNSLKFTLQPQTKYKNPKKETCLQGLLPWDIKKIKKYIPPKCLTAKIQTSE